MHINYYIGRQIFNSVLHLRMSRAVLKGTSSPEKTAASSYILGKKGMPCPLPGFWACHDVHERPMAKSLVRFLDW